MRQLSIRQHVFVRNIFEELLVDILMRVVDTHSLIAFHPYLRTNHSRHLTWLVVGSLLFSSLLYLICHLQRPTRYKIVEHLCFVGWVYYE